MTWSLQECTPGHRDANNAGMTPHDFLERANTFIMRRREKGYGKTLPAEFALLSLEDVLAVRLGVPRYTSLSQLA